MKNKLNKNMLGVFKRQKQIFSILGNWGNMRTGRKWSMFFSNCQKKGEILLFFSPLALI